MRAAVQNNIQAGMRAQKAAEEYLCKNGFSMIEANFRAPNAEIDLIMQDGDYIVFVEVKYRQSLEYGLPREAVGPHKQKQIKKAAMHFIVRNRLTSQDFRFDVVEVLGGVGPDLNGMKVNHIENAFW